MLAIVVENAEFEAAPVRKKIRCIKPPAELLVMGDETLLIAAIENIVRNAIRYTASQTSVEIEVAAPDGSPSAIISVRDHGPGVPEDAIGKIFEPFYRVSAARNRDDGGAGLGLSIAQRSVALCAGDLSARNHPQGGLVIELRLRRVAAV